MMYFLLVVFSLPRLATCPHTDTYNVGTVLFRESDMRKKSWTKEDLALLDARRTMQDLVPAKPMDTQTDAYISELMAYFSKSAEITHKSTEGRARTLMLMALYDVIGGYLRAYALPVSRLAYYAGTVRYHHVEVLNNVYNQIKAYLRTDGSAWSSDMGLRRVTPAISPLKISPFGSEESREACRHLDLHAEPGRSLGPRTRADLLTVPMPYLDDPTLPAAIAVPLDGWPMVSVLTRGSEGVLRSYYVCAVKCLAGQHNSQAHIEQFHAHFNSWLKDNVIPHLKGDRWYPGFSGVVQILETMRLSGVNGAKEAIDWLWQTRPMEDHPRNVEHIGPTAPRATQVTRISSTVASTEAEVPAVWITFVKHVNILYIFGICIGLLFFGMMFWCCCCWVKLWKARKLNENKDGPARHPMSKYFFGSGKGYERLAEKTPEEGRINVPPEPAGIKLSLGRQYRKVITTAGVSNRLGSGAHKQTSRTGKTLAEFEQEYNDIMKQNASDLSPLSSESEDEQGELELFSTTLAQKK